MKRRAVISALVSAVVVVALLQTAAGAQQPTPRIPSSPTPSPTTLQPPPQSPVEAPKILTFTIEYGKPLTFVPVVRLQYSVIGAVEYRVSEKPDFSGAKWERLPGAINSSLEFVLSPKNGLKTIYFQVRGARGELSEVKHAGIEHTRMQ